jgi:hypothetical protein
METRLYKILKIALVTCCIIIVTLSLLTFIPKDDFSETDFSEADFPLAVVLSGRVFSVGDKLSGTVTVTNMCGKNVWVVSNGYMPSACLFNISDTDRVRVERMSMWEGILKADGNLSRGLEFELTEPDTYVLYVYYSIEVNGVGLYRALEDIIIEVK